MNALKCKEHFERTLVRPVGRSAGLREVNERKYNRCFDLLKYFLRKSINFDTVVPLKNILLYTNGDIAGISQRLYKPRHESVTTC